MITLFRSIVRYALLMIAHVPLFIGFLLTSDTWDQTYIEWLEKYADVKE